MIGQKGLPATYGGIEHHVEQVGRLLAQRDDVEVTVYCRRHYGSNLIGEYQGMRLVHTPTVSSKHLEAITHSLTSTVHALWSGADVVHYHALGPAMAAPLVRYLSHGKVVLTVHGLDHERAKWKGPASQVLTLAHRMSGHVPDAVITVSQALTEHYQDRFDCQPVYVPNGVAMPSSQEIPERLRSEHGLEPGGYVLFVGRIVPEKRVDLLVRAARQLPADVKVVVVGGSSFSEDYVAEVVALAGDDPRIVLPGFLYKEELAGVYANAAAFVQPSDVEGLPLTMLEAVSYGLPVVASDIPPHLEILAGCRCSAHRTFPQGDAGALGAQLAAIVADREASRVEASREAAALVAPYSWSAASEALVDVYTSVTGTPRRADGVAPSAHQQVTPPQPAPLD
jgi:glycosyltransferase involved in cell wall biosynthesis